MRLLDQGQRCPYFRAHARLSFLLRSVSHGVKGHEKRNRHGFLVLVLALMPFCPSMFAAPKRQKPSGIRSFELEADRQRKVGPMYYADGNVVFRYGAATLEADHLSYNEKTRHVELTGHVRLEYRGQTIEAASGWYDLATGKGAFEDVRGAIRATRSPNSALLVSPNPLSFAARRVERLNDETYVVHNAWLTVCDPKRPKWKFYTRRAVMQVNRSVTLHGADFRMFSIPLFYLPYAKLAIGKNLRESGFLIPDVGESSLKGFVLGDSYYWAPTNWMDMTLGGQYFSSRGWSERASLRATPAKNVRFSASYFGVSDRGFAGPGGVTIRQGGYDAHEELSALFGDGWRLAADLNQLSSLQFRLAFSETFSQAVNPEVRSSAFVARHFDGYSLDFAALNYNNFLTISPEQSVVVRRAPEARFSSIDRPLFRHVPLYFGFDLFADAMHRSESGLPATDTGPAVQRTEAAPSLTLPLHWGPWLGVTSRFVARTTRYGARQEPNGQVINSPLDRTTEELTIDVRPPSLAREWGSSDSRWKHVIEPDFEYRDVNGVNDFSQIIPFTQDETLTDTNEIEYSITQRLFHRSASGSASQLVSWKVAQKYFFDPTFGGALVPGQRNVFQALDSLTPFAFADRARSFSPVISDLRITPGGRWDIQFRQDVDPIRGKLVATGTLVKIRPWRETFLTLAHFDVHTNPLLQPRSNQIRSLAGFGDMSRQGWNASFGISYDARQQLFQNQIAEIGYNGSCCGIAFEYRRLALGPLRTENQFRIALQIANIGTFGNIGRREKIF